MNSSFMNIKILKDALIKNFPTKSLVAVYAYGSGIFPQKNNKPKMIDLIFVTNDTNKFHQENIKANMNHYSKIAANSNFLRNYVNENGAKIFYNVSVKIEKNINIKYGIISQADFVNALTSWNNIFISGRFHKPIVSVLEVNDESGNRKEMTEEKNNNFLKEHSNEDFTRIYIIKII